MPKTIDLRRIVGSTVKAPACRIIAEQECSRRFGSEKKNRSFTGVITRVYSEKKRGAKRATTFVEAKYDLELSTKRTRKVSLTIQTVKAADPQPPSTPEAIIAPSTPEAVIAESSDTDEAIVFPISTPPPSTPPTLPPALNDSPFSDPPSSPGKIKCCYPECNGFEDRALLETCAGQKCSTSMHHPCQAIYEDKNICHSRI